MADGRDFEQRRSDRLLLLDRMADFNRDGSLEAQLATCVPHLQAREQELAEIFWDHYAHSTTVLGRWTEDQVCRLKARTARYFGRKISEPMAQGWVDEAQELAESAFLAEIPITVVLAALAATHRASRNIIAHRTDSDMGTLLASLDGLERLSLLEAEIITTRTFQLASSAAREERERAAREFNTRILSLVQQVTNQARNSSQEATGTINSIGKMLRDATQVAEVASESSAAMAETARASADLKLALGLLSAEASRTAELAGEGIAHVEAARRDHAELMAKTEDMAAIVALVRQIAQSTRMLSLNASIEAARSDQESAGFSVIAREMIGLAEKTRNAINEIGDRVADLQKASSGAVQTSSTLHELVVEISDAAGKMTQVACDKSTAASTIAEAVERTASVVEGSARSVNGMRSQLDDISANSCRLQEQLLATERCLDELKEASEIFVVVICSA